ncbi:MAG: polyphosphate kinase 2 family protein [Gemmatimonadales bacterium]|nr:MAG: polyphosphate kinase 2 family protein [Gemmatimonadales bacterium]
MALPLDNPNQESEGVSVPLEDLVTRHLVRQGGDFRLADVDPGDTNGFEDKKAGRKRLGAAIERMAELQSQLYAQDRWAALFIFQAMDAAGKDGTIKHVMSGVNPQGCQVHSFKAPSKEELDHDYLWRCARALPERGRIGIFNRSHYEEVLVVRVHPEYLVHQRLPGGLVTESIWRERFEDIRGFERHLTRNGVIIRKFFLHISRDEQKRRFLSRMEEPEKHWKFSSADVAEREHWDDYMAAYEEAIRETSTPEAPWVVVPSDRKWYARVVVAETIVRTLESLNLSYPVISQEAREDMAVARTALEGDSTIDPR